MVRRRIENWPKILSAMLKDRANMPWEWGRNDCLMFPADIVNALTGFDPAARWRGKYSNQIEAMNILAGYGGIRELIDDALGFKGSESILQAARGDAVVMLTPEGEMAGVVDDTGERIAVPITDKGTLVRFPLYRAVMIWKY